MYDQRTFAFQVSEAVEGIKRTGVMNLATITTVGLSLFILGGFLLGLRNLNVFLDGLQTSYELTIFLERGADRQQADLLGQNLELDPAVATVRFVPKDEALAAMAAELEGEGQAFPELEKNPLPDAYQVLIREGIDFEAFRARVMTYPAVAEVSAGQEWVGKALALVEIARAVGLSMVLILGGASLLIIWNTVQLTVHARREEIEIMALVGATNWFIRVPFLIEGFLQGTAGALLAIVGIFTSYTFLCAKIQAIAPNLQLVTGTAELVRLGAQLLLMGMILGLLGALLSLRRILV